MLKSTNIKSDPLGGITSDWPPMEHRTVDYNPLAVSFQPFLYLSGKPPFKSMSGNHISQFFQDAGMHSLALLFWPMYPLNPLLFFTLLAEFSSIWALAVLILSLHIWKASLLGWLLFKLLYGKRPLGNRTGEILLPKLPKLNRLLGICPEVDTGFRARHYIYFNAQWHHRAM